MEAEREGNRETCEVEKESDLREGKQMGRLHFGEKRSERGGVQGKSFLCVSG
jgi:hypothetical protein